MTTDTGRAVLFELLRYSADGCYSSCPEPAAAGALCLGGNAGSVQGTRKICTPAVTGSCGRVISRGHPGPYHSHWRIVMLPTRTVRAPIRTKIEALESKLFSVLRERWRRSLLLQDDPHPGIDWVENTQEIQTLVFYCQLLPIIFRCVEYCPSNPTRIADVGAATGAGGGLGIEDAHESHGAIGRDHLLRHKPIFRTIRT